MTNHEQAKWYLSNIDKLTYEQLADAMTYKWFRLNVLYHIKNKQGKKVLFTPNEEQEERFLNHHGRDLILKARQLGFTTLIAIYFLDCALFRENVRAGIIAQNDNVAKTIFRDKIQFQE